MNNHFNNLFIVLYIENEAWKLTELEGTSGSSSEGKMCIDDFNGNSKSKSRMLKRLFHQPSVPFSSPLKLFLFRKHFAVCNKLNKFENGSYIIHKYINLS